MATVSNLSEIFNLTFRHLSHREIIKHDGAREYLVEVVQQLLDWTQDRRTLVLKTSYDAKDVEEWSNIFGE